VQAFGLERDAFDIGPGEFLRPRRLTRRFRPDVDAFLAEIDEIPLVQAMTR
jgi:hypothetical protein